VAAAARRVRHNQPHGEAAGPRLAPRLAPRRRRLRLRLQGRGSGLRMRDPTPLSSLSDAALSPSSLACRSPCRLPHPLPAESAGGLPSAGQSGGRARLGGGMEGRGGGGAAGAAYSAEGEAAGTRRAPRRRRLRLRLQGWGSGLRMRRTTAQLRPARPHPGPRVLTLPAAPPGCYIGKRNARPPGSREGAQGRAAAEGGVAAAARPLQRSSLKGAALGTRRAPRRGRQRLRLRGRGAALRPRDPTPPLRPVQCRLEPLLPPP
jgi:hypothetical protein